MATTTDEARREILEDLGDALDEVAMAVACLGEAFELLPDAAADKLEEELFQPVQKAYARGRRTWAGFAGRSGLPGRAFDLPSAGLPSQGVKNFVERAVVAAETADRRIAASQDSMLPIESGDAELRAGLGEVRELLAALPDRATRFLSLLGR